MSKEIGDAYERVTRDEKAQAALVDDLIHLVSEWESLGINPDDFVTCGDCHRIFPGCEAEEDGEPVCQCGEILHA